MGTKSLLLGTIGSSVVNLQSAYGISDPNENSATEFAPGLINREPGSVDENAPSAYGDPNQVGDPNQIDDPTQRAPGLLKQGVEFPE